MCKFIAERIITCQCTNENLGNSLTKRDFRLQSGNLVYKMRFSFTKRDSWVTNGTLALHFTLAKEVWNVNEGDLPYEDEAMRAHAKEMVFPIGAPNDGFAQYFSGKSFLAPVSTSQVGIFNVTFEPGCRNNWHIHHAKSGGGQILVCVAGRGYYQEEGKEAIEMKPGDCINIPAEVKHWHGAAPDSWFSHLAVEVPGEEASNEWCEPVSDADYNKLK